MASAVEERVEQGLRGGAAIQQFQGFVAGVIGRAGAHGPKHLRGGIGVGLASEPVGANLFRSFKVVPEGTVSVQVELRGIAFGAITVAVEDGVHERAQDRLGMLPTDGFECAKAVGNIDFLVPNLPEIPRAVAAKDFKDLVRSGGAGEADDGGVAGGFIPVVHRVDERLPGLVCGWDGGFVDRAHRPIAFLHVGGLGAFELVDGPEYRQPAVGVGRGKTGEVGGVDHEHGVEFEADGPWLDVPHARQEQRGEHFAIGRAALDAGGDFLEHAFARRIFQQAHERLDFGVQPYGIGFELRLSGGNGTELGQEPEFAQARERGGAGGGFEEGSSFHAHGFAPGGRGSQPGCWG